MLNDIRRKIIGATLIVCISPFLQDSVPNYCSPNSSESNDLKTEFLENAPKAWLRFRKEYFENRALKTSERSTYKRQDGSEESESLLTSVAYSSAPLFYEEKKVSASGKIISRKIVGGNAQYCFSLMRDGLTWKLLGTEILEKQIEGSQPTDLAMNRPLDHKPHRSIRIAFSRSIILNVGGRSVESFFEEIKNSISSVTEKRDPDLGRLVTVDFDSKSESTRPGKSKIKARRMYGSITFLPEKLWVIQSCDLNYESLGHDGEVVANSKTEMDFDYSDGSSIPKSGTFNSISSTGMESESFVTLEPLTRQEIFQVRNKCYLSRFGLSPPAVESWGWPR